METTDLSDAAALLVLWLLGFFVLHLGVLIHALIAIAIIVAVFIRSRPSPRLTVLGVGRSFDLRRSWP